MKYTFSDQVLAVVAQSLQLALLTGTDIVDHLRIIEVEPDPSDVTPSVGQETVQLTLTDGCRARVKRTIEELEAKARTLSAPPAAGPG